MSTEEAKTAPRHTEYEDVGVTETIQSLIVAFVLAMTFRGFVVEGFVIPTGSMAPTLMGEHLLLRSEQTGYEYPAAITNQTDMRMPAPDPMVNPGLGAGTVTSMSGVKPTPNGGIKPRMGDRILVLKSLFNMFDPDRFEVIVFKNPTDPNGPSGNYIKRLAGLPNEWMWLADGDVFSKPTDEAEYAIRRKPEHVQRAVWQRVYDSDYIPHDPILLKAGPEKSTYQGSPWTGEHWETQNTRVFKCDVSSETTLNWDNEIWPIEDYCSYNVLARNPLRQNAVPISDLRVKAAIVPEEDGFETTFTLNARGSVFEYDLTTDRVGIRMRGQNDDGWRYTQEFNIDAFDPGEVTNIEFWHVDQAMRLFINRKEVAAIEYEWSAEERLAAATQEDPAERPLHIIAQSPTVRPQLSWTFSGSPVEMRGVRVDRDIHYRARGGEGAAVGTYNGGILKLGPDQFMMLGDNSPNSSDSRYWKNVHPMVAAQIDDTVNVVHRKMLIGKAWVVYFPAPHPVGNSKRSLIPDFGRLRFIR